VPSERSTIGRYEPVKAKRRLQPRTPLIRIPCAVRPCRPRHSAQRQSHRIRCCDTRGEPPPPDIHGQPFAYPALTIGTESGCRCTRERASS
jgi:hypothetical protein